MALGDSNPPGSRGGPIVIVRGAGMLDCTPSGQTICPIVLSGDLPCARLFNVTWHTVRAFRPAGEFSTYEGL